MIALLNYYEGRGGAQYLAAAESLGEWIETNARDSRGTGGFTGGYSGPDNASAKLLWKSTEHNLDLYVAFERLYRITGQDNWRQRAQQALEFIDTMWNDGEGFYWTGTLTDGITINQRPIPLDAQTWSLLAFGPNAKTLRGVSYAEVHHRVTHGNYEGFDFDTDRDLPWSEGTGQMALVYWATAEAARGQYFVNELREVQTTATNTNGKGIVAAPADGLTTGLGWAYYNRLHVGATAWFAFAERYLNPFWGTSYVTPRVYLPLVSRDVG